MTAAAAQGSSSKSASARTSAASSPTKSASAPPSPKKADLEAESLQKSRNEFSAGVRAKLEAAKKEREKKKEEKLAVKKKLGDVSSPNGRYLQLCELYEAACDAQDVKYPDFVPLKTRAWIMPGTIAPKSKHPNHTGSPFSLWKDLVKGDEIPFKQFHDHMFKIKVLGGGNAPAVMAFEMMLMSKTDPALYTVSNHDGRHPR